MKYQKLCLELLNFLYNCSLLRRTEVDISSFVLTAKGQKGNEGIRGPTGIRGRPGRPGPAIFFDSSEEVITIKGEKVSMLDSFLETLKCFVFFDWVAY